MKRLKLPGKPVKEQLRFERVLPHSKNGHLFMNSDEMMQHSIVAGDKFDPDFLDSPRVGKDGQLRFRCRQPAFTKAYLGNHYKCLLDDKTHFGQTSAVMCIIRVAYAIKWRWRMDQIKGYDNLMELAHAKQGLSCLKCPLIRRWIGTKKGEV